ncbi:hypothetical protein [Pseudomonas sp. EA_35y_Pfl2_R111]|uniref:hypothetical protein n=1 Tax=Pseudomonas sp. EA_35y_Pfl2_R111 TaxID=3088689 RepID=UPI0030DC65F2
MSADQANILQHNKTGLESGLLCLEIAVNQLDFASFTIGKRQKSAKSGLFRIGIEDRL